EPRTSVPAGSVGLAGEFSAVYPRSSPGGWQLLGRTDATLWDVGRQPPALLQPGSVVRFVDADNVDADNVDADTPAGIDTNGDPASR
ncbi:MAG: carboxyltransferase domain-containing protein, partial [Chloroflexota bacterium]|nr:carboxyltransferase domain-containing protein [Chloroflexota bacterium]